jgi:hypothetical protein
MWVFVSLEIIPLAHKKHVEFRSLFRKKGASYGPGNRYLTAVNENR